MATGRVPDPNGPSRERDEARRLGEPVDLPAEGGELRGPELPDPERFGARTVEWYRNWRRTPQSAQFTVTDWQRLHMLALVVEQFFQVPDTKLMAEIRLNEERLGATPVDRLRLGWRVLGSGPRGVVSAPGVPSLPDRARERAARVPRRSVHERFEAIGDEGA